MSIQNIKSTLAMGARSNKYRIDGTLRFGSYDGTQLDTLCKGSSIPAKTMGTVEVWNQGRKLTVAGDAQYEGTWTLTFYNTQDHALRKTFEDWITAIDDVETHLRQAGSHTDYMSEFVVSQLSTNDNSVTASYLFKNIFPTNISSVELAADSNDTISEFTVDFAYSHWVRAL